MANERRTRANFQNGTILDDPLVDSATTMNSAELVALPVVTTNQHMAITLDPFGQFEGPEIAWITAHDGGAATATIARAKEGTTAVEHPVDTPWAHGVTAADYEMFVGAASDLPATGYFIGQRAYIVGTQKHVVWNGVRWDPPWSSEWGILGGNKSAGTGSLGAFITAETVVLTTDAGITIPSNRLLRVRAKVDVTVGTDGLEVEWRLRRGTNTAGTSVMSGARTCAVANRPDTIDIDTFDRPGAGALRYALTIKCFGASGAAGPWEWYIEDTGPFGNPA